MDGRFCAATAIRRGIPPDFPKIATLRVRLQAQMGDDCGGVEAGVAQIYAFSRDGSCKVVSWPFGAVATAASRLAVARHSLAGRTVPSLPIWSMSQ